MAYLDFISHVSLAISQRFMELHPHSIKSVSEQKVDICFTISKEHFQEIIAAVAMPYQDLSFTGRVWGELDAGKGMLELMTNDYFRQNGLLYDIQFSTDHQSVVFNVRASAESTIYQPKDLEGYYYVQLLQAKKQERIEEQVFYLQKLADLYILKKNWTQAAKLLNGAYALCHSSQLKNDLLAKIESIEGLFLESQRIKTVVTQNGSVASYRELINAIRAPLFNAFKEGTNTHEILPLLTNGYKKLLSTLILDSQKILGSPPCQWACIGMGSMARGEMCPYSDLEFAFLIDENTKKNHTYFKALSQLLELRIINFGETHFPIFGKLFEEEFKQSPTPKGLSLDTGGNTPLGKPGFYELIGTPEKLATFQSTQWLKDDIIVTNALSIVCYVTGNKELLEKYNHAKSVLHKEAPTKTGFFGFMTTIGAPFSTDLGMCLLEGHLQEFKPDLSKQKQTTSAFGIKKELYRPFQSILASITLFAKLPTSSTLNMIGQLLNTKIFCLEGANNLTRALQHVLNLRLEAHIFYQHEGEFLLHQENNPNPHYLYLDQKKIDTLHEIYRILIPFHQCAEKFLQTRDLKVFAKALFYDEKPDVQGDAFEKELQYAKAQEAHQHAVSLNPHDAKAQRALGNIEHTMAQYKEALQRHTEALKLAQARYGENHLDVATSYISIGLVYENLGNFENAMEFYQKALKIQLQVLGEKNSHVATSYGNIGAVYDALGSYEKAMEFHLKAVKILPEVLGEQHPHVAASYNNIGMVYHALGNYEKALEFYQKALQIYLQVLGEKHPDVATSYNNIGAVYKALGNYEKALEFYQKALQIYLQVLGEKHPDVATSYNNIGAVYKALGNYEKALEFYQKALQIYLQVLGEKHPDVATSYNHIGMVYRALGNYEKALEFYQKALQILLHVLGEKHPSVASSYRNIGLVYQALGNYEKALELLQKALSIWVESYRKNHPHIQMALKSVINCSQEIPFAQRKGLRETRTLCLKILGSDDPLIQELFELMEHQK